MKSETFAGLRLFYDPQEVEAARLIGKACEKSAQLLQRRWGLDPPGDCRVYVMTSWSHFLFHSAPWHWKIYLALTFPLVARRAAAIWPYAGGWALQYGKRRVVGVKPPRSVQMADRSLGEQIFKGGRDLGETVQTVTCHELVHAFTSHLRLPTWLHEGLATLAMELYLERRIIREDTLENLASQSPPLASRRGREKLRVEDTQRLVSQYARGYWLARYIDETRPVLLKDLLSERRSQSELEEKLASAYGKDRESFWQGIDRELRSLFGSRLA
jgi:hypothetical protein